MQEVLIIKLEVIYKYHNSRIYLWEVNLERKHFKVILPVGGVSSYTPTWKALAPVATFSLQVHRPSNEDSFLSLGPRIIWACLLSLVILIILLNVPPEFCNRLPFVKYQATGSVGWLHVRLLLLTFCLISL